MRELQQHVDDDFTPSLALGKRSLAAIESFGYRRSVTVDLRPEFRQIDRQPRVGRITV